MTDQTAIPTFTDCWVEIGYINDPQTQAFETVEDSGRPYSVIAPLANSCVTIDLPFAEADADAVKVMFGGAVRPPVVLPADLPRVEIIHTSSKPTWQARIRCFLTTGHDWIESGLHGWEHQWCTHCRAERFID